MFRNFKVLFVIFAIVIVSITAYAFATANTVPDTKAGAGSGVISGYTITTVVYNLNATDPSDPDSLSATALTVKIKLVVAGEAG